MELEKKGINSFYLTDSKNKRVPCQYIVESRWEDGSIRRAKISFEAKVPADGYSTYSLVPGENPATPEMNVSESKIENRFYTVTIDPVSGGIRSIYDKTAQKELIKSAKYTGNEIIAFENFGVDEAEEFTGKFWRMGDNPVSLQIKEKGPVKAVWEIKGKILDSPVTQYITMYSGIPRIDFSTELDWNGKKRIQVNTAYPFDVPDGKLNYEVPFGNVEYGAENPWAQACHTSIRATNNWIDLSNSDFGVTLATEVTPFDTKDRRDPIFMDARKVKGQNKENTFTLDLFPGIFSRIALDDPVLLKSDFVVQPIMFRSVFSCGDSALYFTQKGKHSYRFALRGHKGTLKPCDAVRFGMEHNSPLMVFQGVSGKGNLPEEQSFFSCSQPNVIITVIKKAEDGKGLILRCYETDGLATKVTIKSLFNLGGAYHTNIIESNEKALGVGDGHTLAFEVGKHSIETIRLILK